jgi:nicotinamidase-related amidase
MSLDKIFHLQKRSQKLQTDENGHTQWEILTSEQSVPAARTAILICDMWDRHWSRGAVERVEAMAPRMNEIIESARQAGAFIIHAPSETLTFYENSPARRRLQALTLIEPPANRELPDPPLPIDDTDGGSDTGEKPWYPAWTRQHPAITIDDARDVISDSGIEIYSYVRANNIQQVLLMGVHTNMCVLNRSFGIKQMVRWDVPIVLVRDQTDTMYNPAMPPYVSHAEGTRLVVEYIEKFWCPTVVSEDLNPMS